MYFFSGPALGSFLYALGGFTLPFLSVGSFALVMAVVLCVVVPPVKMDDRDANDPDTKSLTFTKLIKVGRPSQHHHTPGIKNINNCDYVLAFQVGWWLGQSTLLPLNCDVKGSILAFFGSIWVESNKNGW